MFMVKVTSTNYIKKVRVDKKSTHVYNYFKI